MFNHSASLDHLTSTSSQAHHWDKVTPTAGPSYFGASSIMVMHSSYRPSAAAALTLDSQSHRLNLIRSDLAPGIARMDINIISMSCAYEPN